MGQLGRLATGVVAGAVTLQQMIRELHRDGELSRATAAVLDGPCVAHAYEVWRYGRDDPIRLPLHPKLTRAVGGAAVTAGIGLMAAGMLRFPSEAQINARGDQARTPRWLGRPLDGRALTLRACRSGERTDRS